MIRDIQGFREIHSQEKDPKGPLELDGTCSQALFFKDLFIHERHTERQAEGEAGSMQAARCRLNPGSRPGLKVALNAELPRHPRSLCCC